MSLLDLNSPAASALPIPAEAKPRPSRWRRAIKRLAIVAAIFVVLIGASTIANATITASEKSAATPYGQIVHLPSGDINVYRNGGTGPVMVMLSGLGTAAPAIDFAPLIRKLDGYNVIVIEGFGYGYSDLNVANRSVENITSEVHQVLTELDVDSPVILVAHSVGGAYAHFYANQYPGTVSAIIGIDPTPARTSSLEVGSTPTITRTLNSSGLVRWVNALSTSLWQPDGTAFTEAERKQIGQMTNWNFGNLAVADEWNQLAANLTKTNAEPFPATVPVLEFLSTASIDSIPHWESDHQKELASVSTHQIDVLDGGHYLHWTQAAPMAKAIDEFLSTNVHN